MADLVDCYCGDCCRPMVCVEYWFVYPCSCKSITIFSFIFFKGKPLNSPGIIFAFMQAKDIDRGAYIKIKNEIYKLKRKEVVAVGTHSHTKLKFFCKPLFGASEREFTFGHNDSVETVDISKKRGQLISLQGRKAQVMDSETFEIFDAEVSEDCTDELVEGTPASFMNIEGKVYIVNNK